MSETPHIIISHFENIPTNITKDIVDAMDHPNLKLVSEKLESPGPFAAIDWLLPTAVILFVTKAYFNEFLKEMGKDHYHLLKKGILSVWNKLLGKDREIQLTSIGTSGKVKSSKYSLAFSIWSELNDEYRIKFLFEEKLLEAQFEENITLILKLLEAIHMEKGNKEDYLIIEDDITPIGRTVLIAYDKDRKKLRMVSPLPKTK